MNKTPLFLVFPVYDRRSLQELLATFNTKPPAALGIEGFELRLDFYARLTPVMLASYRFDIDRLKRFGLPLIVTIRPQNQGGHYRGSARERMQLLNQSAALFKPDYVDLESSIPIRAIRFFKKKHPQIGIIFSKHFLKPALLSRSFIHRGYARLWATSLRARINPQRLSRHPPFCIKLAFCGRSGVDALHLLLRMRHYNRQNSHFIGVLMHAMGESTRILAPLCRAPLTYTVWPAAQTRDPAIPILSLDLLRQRYHYHHLNAETAVYGLIGDPVEQSVGVIFHNAFFQQEGRNAVYVAWSVPAKRLPEAFALLDKLPIHGLSVTMPLKQAVIPFVSDSPLSEQKAALAFPSRGHALNTLHRAGPSLSWQGCNTDGIGLCAALYAYYQAENRMDRWPLQTLVFVGASGTSMAMIQACRDSLWSEKIPLIGPQTRIILLNRDRKKAEIFAAQYGPCCVVASLDSLTHAADWDYDLILHTVPAQSPLPFGDKTFIPRRLVAQMAYPQASDLLVQAHKQGCSTLLGDYFFPYQARFQQAYWWA